MAGEKLGYVYSAYSGANLVEKEGMFVSITGAKNGLPIVTITADALKADGVILRGDVQDATSRIAKTGIVMVKADAAIAAAEEVEVKNGKAAKKASGVAVGKALSAAVANDIIPVMLY